MKNKFNTKTIAIGSIIVFVLFSYIYFSGDTNPIIKSNGGSQPIMQIHTQETAYNLNEDYDLTNTTKKVVEEKTPKNNDSQNVEMLNETNNNTMPYLLNDLYRNDTSLQKKTLARIRAFIVNHENPDEIIDEQLVDALINLKESLDKYNEADKKGIIAKNVC